MRLSGADEGIVLNPFGVEASGRESIPKRHLVIEVVENGVDDSRQAWSFD